MKVRNFTIENLNKNNKTIHLEFNDDINILTGRNGSGKTTILKAIWYSISGNIERVISEINFSKISLETDAYSLEIRKNQNNNAIDTAQIKITTPNGKTFESKSKNKKSDYINEANHFTCKLLNESIFFPTFRRIEGGFSMTAESEPRKTLELAHNDIFMNSDRGSVQASLSKLSGMLSVYDHKFVSSISTFDIQELVARKHVKATEEVELYSKSLSESIFSQIKEYNESNTQKGEQALREAQTALNQIYNDVIHFESHREQAFKPIEILSNTTKKILLHNGIKLTNKVTFGDIQNSISSDSLSAGEKQMLSFLCYNMLYSNCPFLIDEPELSLHIDWQRILLKTLTNQTTGNQFFIATHSPFIYSQYPDKEIILGSDQGEKAE